MRFRVVFAVALGCGVGVSGGCGSDSLPKEPDLHPVTGKVTVQGEPLEGAVVTFLQVDEKGTTALGETDENGTYILSHVFRPGAAAAEYIVSVSYLEGQEGQVFGVGPRSAFAKPPEFTNAKERVVPEWSDFGISTQRVTVREGGGVFDFDLPELLPPPEPMAGPEGAEDTEAEPAEPSDASESTEGEPTAEEEAVETDQPE